MGNAIIMGSGKTPPPNSVEIEVTAAEDIKAGEFIGLELQTPTQDGYADFTALTFSKLRDVYNFQSNVNIDGVYLYRASSSASGQTLCLIQIFDDGTIEQGTTITIPSNNSIGQVFRFDNHILIVTSKGILLYRMQGLELVYVSTTDIGTVYNNTVDFSGTYDTNNTIFTVSKRTTKSGHVTRFYKFTNGEITLLYETTMPSASVYVKGICSIKKSSGYEIRVIYVDTYNNTSNLRIFDCDRSFQNWTLRSEQVAIPKYYIYDNVILNNLIYGNNANMGALCLFQIQDDYSVVLIGLAKLNGDVSNYIKALLPGEIGIALCNQRQSGMSTMLTTSFCSKENTGDYPLNKIVPPNSGNTDCVFFFTSALKGILISGSQYKNVDICKAKKTGVELTGIAKTSALQGNKLKVWMSKGPAISYLLTQTMDS